MEQAKISVDSGYPKKSQPFGQLLDFRTESSAVLYPSMILLPTGKKKKASLERLSLSENKESLFEINGQIAYMCAMANH